MQTVEQRMTRRVVTLTENQTLRDAFALMQRHRIRHVPVVSDGRVLGILTDRDVKRATPSLLSGIEQAEFDKILNETQVGHTMTRDPYTVTPSTPLLDAAKVMLDRKYGALPVVEHDRLVGILTGSDLLRALCEMLEE